LLKGGFQQLAVARSLSPPGAFSICWSFASKNIKSHVAGAYRDPAEVNLRFFCSWCIGNKAARNTSTSYLHAASCCTSFTRIQVISCGGQRAAWGKNSRIREESLGNWAESEHEKVRIDGENRFEFPHKKGGSFLLPNLQSTSRLCSICIYPSTNILY